MSYLLDTNVFINAKNHHYGFDFCPAFWDWIDSQNASGAVFSVEKVQDEIREGDELSVWTAERPELFLPVDEDVLASMRATSAWASGATYENSAVNTYLNAADSFLVAHAHATDMTVVTHELSRPESTARIMIPDACAALDVPCITPFEMLRAEGARFENGS